MSVSESARFTPCCPKVVCSCELVVGSGVALSEAVWHLLGIPSPPVSPQLRVLGQVTLPRQACWSSFVTLGGWTGMSPACPDVLCV